MTGSPQEESATGTGPGLAPETEGLVTDPTPEMTGRPPGETEGLVTDQIPETGSPQAR